jgi:hypothetical protein
MNDHFEDRVQDIHKDVFIKMNNELQENIIKSFINKKMSFEGLVYMHSSEMFDRHVHAKRAIQLLNVGHMDQGFNWNNVTDQDPFFAYFGTNRERAFKFYETIKTAYIAKCQQLNMSDLL